MQAWHKTGDDHLHLTFWCDAAQWLGVHDLRLEWIAAGLVAFGWIPWLGGSGCRSCRGKDPKCKAS